MCVCGGKCATREWVKEWYEARAERDRQRQVLDFGNVIDHDLARMDLEKAEARLREVESRA